MKWYAVAPLLVMTKGSHLVGADGLVMGGITGISCQSAPPTTASGGLALTKSGNAPRCD